MAILSILLPDSRNRGGASRFLVLKLRGLYRTDWRTAGGRIGVLPSFSTDGTFSPTIPNPACQLLREKDVCPQRGTEHSAFPGCLGVEGGNRPLDLVASAFRALWLRCLVLRDGLALLEGLTTGFAPYSYVGMAPPDRLRFSNYRH